MFIVLDVGCKEVGGKNGITKQSDVDSTVLFQIPRIQ